MEVLNETIKKNNHYYDYIYYSYYINIILNNFHISSIAAISNPPNVGVLLFNFNDPYMSLVRQSLENIEKENPNKVRFSFYDAKDNQSIQNETIGNLINNSNVDLLLVNLVDTKQSTISDIINKASIKNIPLIFFNIDLPIDIKTTYEKVFVVATESKKEVFYKEKFF